VGAVMWGDCVGAVLGQVWVMAATEGWLQLPPVSLGGQCFVAV
jgi:hypothetical protein